MATKTQTAKAAETSKIGRAKTQNIGASAKKAEEVGVNVGAGIAQAGAAVAKAGGQAIKAAVDQKKLRIEGEAKAEFSISEAAIGVLEDRKSSNKLGTLPIPGEDETRSASEMRSDEINESIRGKLGGDISDKLLSDTRTRFDLLAGTMAANKGNLTQDDLGIIINSDLRRLINQNPAFEDEIIAQAKQSLGFDPTPSATREALAGLVSTPASETPLEKQVRGLVALGMPEQDAIAQTVQMEEMKFENALDDYRIQQNKATGETYARVAARDIQAIEVGLHNTWAARQRDGKNLDIISKNTINQDIESVTGLYNAAIQKQLQYQVQSGVDTTATVQRLTMARDDKLRMIENNSLAKQMARNSEFMTTAATHKISLIPFFNEINAAIPNYGGEFSLRYAQIKNNPQALANWRSLDDKANQAMTLVDMMEGELTIAEKVLKSQQINSNDPKERVSAMNHGITTIAGTDIAETAATQALDAQITAVGGQISDALLTLNDPASVSGGLNKPAVQAKAGELVGREAADLAAWRDGLSEDQMDLIQVDGNKLVIVAVTAAQAPGGSGFGLGRVSVDSDTKSYVQRVNLMASVAQKWLIDGDFTASHFSAQVVNKSSLKDDALAAISSPSQAVPINQDAWKGKEDGAYRSRGGDFFVVAEGVARTVSKNEYDAWGEAVE